MNAKLNVLPTAGKQNMVSGNHVEQNDMVSKNKAAAKPKLYLPISSKVKQTLHIPSPWSSAFRAMQTYLTTPIRVRVQNMML